MNIPSQPQEKRAIRPIEWVGLIALFLLAGSIGHDPWKLHEPYVFGVIYHFFTTQTWLVPVNAGLPFMEKPPLYHWTAVVFCYLLGGVLPLHDAARMASVFYTALTAIFMWKTGRVLFAARPQRNALGWISVALLLGQIDIINDTHLMRTDVPLLTGTTIAMYGIALLGHMPERWKRAGAWIGLGFGIAFMSKGLFIPIALIMAGAALWHFVPALQNENARRALGIAGLVALPFVTLWPGLIYLHSPALFKSWFWDNNVGRFLGFYIPEPATANCRHNFIISMLKNSFPAWPLACWGIGAGKRQWRSMEYMLPVSILGFGLVLLLISATGNGCYLLPLLPSFALLAAPMLLQLSQRFMAWWNLSARVLASVTAVGIWLVWLNLHYPLEMRFFPSLMNLVGNWPPLKFSPPDQTFACATALLAALFWLASFRLPSRLALNTAYIWFAGISLLWVTATLLYPWQNAEKSYRGVLMEMVDVVHRFPGKHNCVQADIYDEIISPMFNYVAKPLLPPRKKGEACPFLFVPAADLIPSDIDAHWHLVWKGSRYLDKRSEIRLYQEN